MSIRREKNTKMLTFLSERLAKTEFILIAEYTGITVSQISVLRSEARKAGVFVRVLKNTMVRHAVSGTAFDALGEKMTGHLIYGMSDDPVAVANLFHQFSKTNDKLVLRAAAMPNRVLGLDQIKALASLPSREVLLAMLAGTLQAPIVKFARVANEIPSSLVRVLTAYRDSKAA